MVRGFPTAPELVSPRVRARRGPRRKRARDGAGPPANPVLKAGVKLRKLARRALACVDLRLRRGCLLQERSDFSGELGGMLADVGIVVTRRHANVQLTGVGRGPAERSMFAVG